MSSPIEPSQRDFDVSSDGAAAHLQGEDHLHVSEVKKRSLAGVLAFFSRTIFLTGTAIIAQYILGAVLTPQDYGIYGIVVTISGFFTIISDVGLAASLIQKREHPTTEELRTVFTTQQILSWIVFILVTITSYVLFTYDRLSIEGVYLAAAFGLTFPIVSIKTISAILLERTLEFGKLVLPAIVETIVFHLVSVVLALQGFGVMSFTYAVIAKAVVGVLVMLYLKRWEIGFAFSTASFKNLMRVGGAFQLNDILAKAKDDVFYLTLAFFIPQTQFGYLTWAKQWSRLPYSLTVDNVTALTFPSFARLQHDEKLLSRAVEKTIFFVTLLSFPLLLGVSVMVIPFTLLVPEYAKWIPAIPPLILFAVSLMFSSFSTPLVSTLNAIGKISESLKMMMFWTVAQWVLFVPLFAQFGFMSVPLISLILSLTSLLVILLVKKYVNFNFTGHVWRQALAAAIMAVILQQYIPLWAESFVHLILGVVLGASIYSVLMIITGFEKIRSEVHSLLKRK